MGRRHVGARIAIKWRQLFKRTLGDDDAGRMGGGVAIKPFDLQRFFEQRGDRFLARALFPQTGLGFKRFGERRVRRIVGDQLAEAIDLTERHAKNTADIAQHRARLQLSKGDDLRDPRGPYFCCT